MSKLSSRRPALTFALEARWRSIRLGHDFIQVPPQEAYFEPVNWYRTKLHELGHYAERRIMPRRSGMSHDECAGQRGISA
jgi:hypothetical protein